MGTPTVLLVDDNRELLNLLSRVFSDAGYRVLAAARGKEALELASREPPALAVIDMLLPDMLGFAVADAIRAQREVPIIFLSGVFKGLKHVTEARTKHGGVEYLEKPFDSQRLLAVAKGIVQPPAPAPRAEVESGIDVELNFDVDDGENDENPLELTGMVRVHSRSVTAELRGEKLVADNSRIQAPPRLRPMPPPSPAQASAAKQQVAASAESAYVRRGDLQDNLPALISAFYLSNETGELGIQRGRVKKVIYFERGQPVYAQSNLITDRFGQFLVRVGKINETQLAVATRRSELANVKIGDALVELGLLEESERLYYLAQQVKSVFYSLFGWEEGTYEMTFRAHNLDHAVRVAMHPANTISRGIKKLYRLERLRRLLPSGAVPIPSRQSIFPADQIELEPWERQLLSMADGSRDVKDLILLARRSEQESSASLYAMVALSLLELAR